MAYRNAYTGHVSFFFQAKKRLCLSLINGIISFEPIVCSGKYCACLCYVQDAYVSTFEMTIRFVGGLLSTYALTEDEVHLFLSCAVVVKLYVADVT